MYSYKLIWKNTFLHKNLKEILKVSHTILSATRSFLNLFCSPESVNVLRPVGIVLYKVEHVPIVGVEKADVVVSSEFD